MMIFDTTPPIVSMPSESGVTSSSSISRLPVTRMSACTAAPSATTSSGFSSLCGVRPNSSSTMRRTSGMRVEPPTSTTSSICDGCSAGVGERLAARGRACARRSGAISASNSRARDRVRARAASRLVACSDRSHFAWMTALRIACIASGVGSAGSTTRRSTNAGSASTRSISSTSMSSPPRCVSPLVDEHLEDAVLDPQDRDVERAAAEVVDGDEAGVPLVEAVGERRGGRLVDDAQHLEAGDAAGVARRRALRVVEVGRHGDDRAVDFGVELALRRRRTPRRGASARAARTRKSPAA